MGQILHGSAKTTHAIRGELQRSQASVASLAKKYGMIFPRLRGHR
jgi:hypothetical protein